MIIESIILAIFACSFGGLIIFLIRKLPVLYTLPKNGTTGIEKHKYVLHFKEKTQDLFLSFKKQVLLHKILSWVRIMTLKIEAKIDNLLRNIRKKAQEVDKEVKKKK